MSSSKFSNEYFKNWFEENFLPSGIVFSTKRAKKIFEKNNLTPSQFLRPFGIMKDYIINVKDYQIKLNSFRVDFFDSTDYHKNKNQISKYLNNCISSEKNIEGARHYSGRDTWHTADTVLVIPQKSAVGCRFHQEIQLYQLQRQQRI